MSSRRSRSDGSSIGIDVQPIVEVLAEAALGHLLGQVAVGGRDDAHVHPRRPLGADRVDLALLQRAQQLDLHVERQLADLVEEQDAAVRLLELAQVLVGGAGEAALLVAEQDGLDQVLRDGAAVDGDERLARAVRAAVHGARDQLLAGAALAEQQDRDLRLGRPLAQPHDHAPWPARSPIRSAKVMRPLTRFLSAGRPRPSGRPSAGRCGSRP